MKLLAKIKVNLEAMNPNNAYKARGIRKGGRVMAMMYLSKEGKDYKELIKAEAEKIMKDKEPYDGPVLARSYWTFGTRRRKDLPNTGKLEYDSLNGIVYDDDSQIVTEEKYKIYDKNNPSIVIELYAIPDYEDWEF